jgi:hypothetical protein
MVALAVIVLIAGAVDWRRGRSGDAAPTRLPVLVDLLVAGTALANAGFAIVVEPARAVLWVCASVCVVLAAVVAIRGVHP